MNQLKGSLMCFFEMIASFAKGKYLPEKTFKRSSALMINKGHPL